ncbi:GGDEF domain-containing protein [Nevskia ramosa]|uniref:GGDEF domain-containing protein n=1 Tax=Nevskia ramosa TaxID=64002 RepID=UPI002357F4E4|nr:GGDEF domain-containing protein [Nevskia ramosa]
MNGEPRIRPHSIKNQRRQLLRLRFDEPLEALFRETFEVNARGPRTMILSIGILMIGVTPLYDHWVMHAPDSFLKMSHFLQFCVQIPAILLALLFTLRPALQRWSPAMLIVTCMIIANCVMAQHIFGRLLGFDMPHDFAAITVTAMLILGRLRFWAVLPWALATMVITTWAQMEALGLTAFYDAVSAWMLAAISGVTAYLLEFSSRQSWYRGRLLEFQATRDGLTGLPNRRYFDLELRKLIREAGRQQQNVALLMLDIDHFKDYNDLYGHPAGDQCLRLVGGSLGRAMRRPQDFCARIGGEEFAAVWFDASPDKAGELAEALRNSVHMLRIPRSLDGSSFVTASGGFAQVIAPSAGDSPRRVAADLVRRADAALYAAKRSGRSRMVMSGDHSRPESANDSLGATNLAVMDDARQAPSPEARAP